MDNHSRHGSLKKNMERCEIIPAVSGAVSDFLQCVRMGREESAQS